MMPPGTRFTAPLHGILPRHVSNLRYVSIYIHVYGNVHIRRCHNHCKHCTAASGALSSPNHLSDASSIIVIRSSVMAAFSDCIQLNCCSISSIILDVIVFLSDETQLVIYVFDLTHVKRIYFCSKSHNSNHILVRLQGVPHWPCFLWNVQTVKL